MKGWMASILAPADAASGIKVLLDKVAAFLKMVDSFDAVAPSELFPQYLRLFDIDPLLSHNVFSHLQHRHWILVRMLGIEIVRRRFIEFHCLLPPHSISPFSSLCLLSVSQSSSRTYTLPQRTIFHCSELTNGPGSMDFQSFGPFLFLIKAQ